MKERQNIKDNLEKILNGELIIKFVPAFRHKLKNSNLIEYKCICGIKDEYNGIKIELDLDHINGDKLNNTRENLRWLCPNCHSQTITWKNKNNRKKKNPSIKDKELIESIKLGGNISEILSRVKLRSGGDNYNRVYQLIKEYGLKRE